MLGQVGSGTREIGGAAERPWTGIQLLLPVCRVSYKLESVQCDKGLKIQSTFADQRRSVDAQIALQSFPKPAYP
jgi:hypothetical protein